MDPLITDAGIPSRARAVLEDTVDHLVLADPSPFLVARTEERGQV